MHRGSVKRELLWKLPLALVCIGLLIGLVAARLFPALPLAQVVLGALTLFVLLVGAAVLLASLMQWILRTGGTDVQWLWFRADPPGLQRPGKPE